MLTESRKRQHSCGDERGHLVPQAKRQKNQTHPLSPEPGRDAWDSESSNSSSGLGTPEHASASSSGSRCAAGPCSPLSTGDSCDPPASYLHINRILREAHFQSLHSRCQARETHQ
ncbi:protein FAM104A-like [Syngnathoides biaculeatus]|uniref:protein FAM104A-like n=1 Tax=Syngnathoides biaculeatus TaxID=300417 RepID=UPI002ADE1EA1|nr:protein FAM104A-like [Syngnathoides biaculeatus]